MSDVVNTDGSLERPEQQNCKSLVDLKLQTEETDRRPGHPRARTPKSQNLNPRPWTVNPQMSETPEQLVRKADIIITGVPTKEYRLPSEWIQVSLALLIVLPPKVV